MIMKTVFLFISNYVHTSDLLRTEYIYYLAKKFKVVVFLPNSFDVNIYPKIENVEYKNLPLLRSKFWFIMKELRMTLNRNNYDWPEFASNRIRSSFNRRKILRILAKVFPKVIFTNKLFALIELALNKKEMIFSELIGKYKPILFLTPTPGLKPFEAQAIIQAQKFNIPTVAVNFSWDNLTSNSLHVRKTDYLIAWNQVEDDDAVKYHGYNKDKVFISGPIRFDYYFKEHSKEISKEEFLKSKRLDCQKKTLLLTSVTKSYPFQKNIIRRLVKLRNNGKIAGNPNIFIRIHPLDKIENYKEFKGINNFYIEIAGEKIFDLNNKSHIEMTKNDLINLKQTLKYCDVNINYASTITIESFIFDIPVVNFTFDDVYGLAYKFKHYSPIAKSGAVKIAKTDDELAEFINFYLDNPENGRDKRKIIAKKYAPFQDGGACKRSVDYLEKIINEAY